MKRTRGRDLFPLVIVGAIFVAIGFGVTFIILNDRGGTTAGTAGIGQAAGSSPVDVTVLNSYWSSPTSLWIRVSLRNSSREPITFASNRLRVVDASGARYELSEPSPNFSADVRLNPNESALAVEVCRTGDNGASGRYSLVVEGGPKIPLNPTPLGQDPTEAQ